MKGEDETYRVKVRRVTKEIEWREKGLLKEERKGGRSSVSVEEGRKDR